MTTAAITTGNYLTLSQAAALLPGRPHSASLWRWARLGVSTHSGERVRLRVGRLGRKMVTTRKWLDEFSQRCAEADMSKWSDEPRAESPEHKAAISELRERGVVS